MKVKIKLLISVVSAFALLMTSTGCTEGDTPSVEWKYPKDEKAAYIEAPPEGTGNRFDITYEEWYSEYLFNMSKGGHTEETNPDVAESYRRTIIDYLAQEKIILYLAEQMGIGPETLTEEEQNTIDKSVQKAWDEWCDSYKTEAVEALGNVYTQEELYDKEYELFSNFLAESGLTPEIFITWETNDFIREKFIEKVSESISDEEVADFVQETIDTAKDMYENDLATFEKSYTAFYVPEGTRTVQQIYVKIDDDAISEIRAYRSDGDDEKADQLLEEALEKVRDRIDEAYEKLQSGEDWAEVQKKYSDDANGINVDYTVYPTSTVVAQEVTDAAMGIEEKGGFSEIITNDSGFFILYYKEDRVFSDEEMQDLLDQARDYMKDTEAYQRIEDFKEEYPYVYNYEVLELSEPVAE